MSRHRATPEGRRAQLLAELAEVLAFLVPAPDGATVHQAGAEESGK